MVGQFYKNLRQAAFRGVLFGVASSVDGRGRDPVVHEYPMRDEPYLEDMGRAKRTIDITGFILGPGYEARRDALIRALEQPGPGTLIHPWLGSFQAALAEPAQISHEAESAGMVTFEMKFIEAGGAARPGSSLNFPALAGLAAALARALAGDGLQNFNLRPINAAALAVGHDWAGGLGETLRPLYPVGYNPPAIADDPAQFLRQINQAARAAGPGPAVGFAELMGQFFPLDLTPDPGGLLRLSLETPVPTVPSVIGTVSRQIAKNKAAVLTYQREMAGLEGLRALADIEPESQAEAEALRETALSVGDHLLHHASSDDFFRAVQRLAATVHRALAEAAGRAPRVIRWRPHQVTPALSLAWAAGVSANFFAPDPGRAADDLARRNRVRHPGFMPSVELEIRVGR